MHIHILGISGTFMAGVAALARSAGHRVSGSDAKCYPPMSTQLENLGIEVSEGYLPEHLQPAPDVVVVGNVLSRGNAAVEYMLEQGLPYTSGPQWLAEHVLAQRWVLAVAGTHGKTTTSSMLLWLLHQAGHDAGFLIGGIPANFGVSARFGESPYFVVEADEYDSAFFDKRSKFVHYHPRTLVLNNLEFDHADIFDDLQAIQRQFHHLLRTVPGNGRIVTNAASESLREVLKMGCWSEVTDFTARSGQPAQWIAHAPQSATSCDFDIECDGQVAGQVSWNVPGRHNRENALAAIAAAAHVGIDPTDSARALSGFAGVKRRLEVLAEVDGITLYDDFAHHPTAIAETLAALRAQVGEGRVLAAFEPRSATMRMGHHQQELAEVFVDADVLWLYEPPALSWDLSGLAIQACRVSDCESIVVKDVEQMIVQILSRVQPGDHVVLMSNGAFGGAHARLAERLLARDGRTAGGRQDSAT